MANHPSAKKRHRQSLKRRSRARATKSTVSGLVRKVNETVESGDKQAAEAQLKTATVALAKAASKGTIHSRNASRRISRLAAKVAKLANL